MDSDVSFSAIEKADLEDNDRLSALYLHAIGRGWWPKEPAAVVDFWALAEKALQEDSHGTPGRLFHALVKSKERARITDGQEQRALRRMPSQARESLLARTADTSGSAAALRQPAASRVDASPLAADAEVDVWAADPDRIVYHHSIMMMCFLPQKRLPETQREYVVRHGLAALRVEAGSLIDPGAIGEFRPLPVPFGTRARMILPYINASAVRTRSRTVDMGRSLRGFMSRLGFSFDGRRGRAMTEQVEALAAAHLLLGVWGAPDGRPRAHLATIADEISFWIERDARQRSLWEPEMTLSQRYYDAIVEHPVPLDMDHLLQLSRSPRRMDLYAWLTYRTARIASGRRVHVKLSALQPVFAPGPMEPALFKYRFRRDLAAVARVYPDFRVKVEGDLVVLEPSPPPVPRSAFVPVSASLPSVSE